MDQHLMEINGDETAHPDGSAFDALIRFYRAFNAGDIEGLEEVWIGGSDSSMDNPIGGIRRGWDEISEGYSTLFKGETKVQVTFHDFTSQGGDEWHLFVGRERGVCQKGTDTLSVAFRTTRWFIRKKGSWRQLHHHGSVEDAQMLAAYQKMIFG